MGEDSISLGVTFVFFNYPTLRRGARSILVNPTSAGVGGTSPECNKSSDVLRLDGELPSSKLPCGGVPGSDVFFWLCRSKFIRSFLDRGIIAMFEVEEDVGRVSGNGTCS